MRIILIMAVTMLGFSHPAFAQAPAKEVVVVDGQIAVNNLPESQTVDGTVSVNNLPDVQDVQVQGVTNPIPVVDVTPNSAVAPSDIVELATPRVTPGNTVDLISVTPEATVGGVFTVPDGRFLVITAVTIFPASLGTDSVQVQFIQNSLARSFWVVPNSQPTTLSFGPGMLVAPGYSLKVRHFAGTGSFRVSLYGYLTDQ